jgi:hypothetical protein
LRHNVVHVVTSMLERTRARLEHAAPGVFMGAIDDFLAEVGPKTPHLRDVPREFLSFAAPRLCNRARVPEWLVDYAELELIDFTIGVAPRPRPPPPLAEVSAELPLVFADPKTLVRLEWAVHELPSDDFTRVPERRPTTLLVYRDVEHRTRFLDLTPLAAAILERLFEGRSLAQAMRLAAESEGAVLGESVLGGAAQLLADLGERGVLLGARAPDGGGEGARCR